jgi:hypothetical protein
MKKNLVVIIAVLVVFGTILPGCLPEQTVVDAGGTPQKSGEVIIAGSLASSMITQEKGAGYTHMPLTPDQWTDIINNKALQVQYVEVRMSDDNGEVYNGLFPVINGGFNVLIKNFPAGRYTINVYFLNSGANQSIFYANDLIDVWPNQPTNVNLVAYLNNYCQKQLRIVGIDPQIAEMTSRATIIIGDADIVGDVFWFPEEPMAMNIVFWNNLSFDFLQPSPIAFTDGNYNYLGGMLLQNIDPVALAGWDIEITYVPINTSDIIINVMTAPPIGVL